MTSHPDHRPSPDSRTADQESGRTASLGAQPFPSRKPQSLKHSFVLPIRRLTLHLSFDNWQTKTSHLAKTRTGDDGLNHNLGEAWQRPIMQGASTLPAHKLICARTLIMCKFYCYACSKSPGGMADDPVMNRRTSGTVTAWSRHVTLPFVDTNPY